MRRPEFFRVAGRVAAGLLAALAASPAAQGGDLLRGGAAYGAPSAATGSYGTNASVTAEARTNASDALARTTQALQAVQAMQSAARQISATRPSAVPNGLTAGGLRLTPGTQVVGATRPVQSVAGGQTTVTVTQRAQQAFLNWQTFNIGKNTTLDFNQSAGGSDSSQWIAFNKINDPSGVPSQILGSIRAQGQVYVINQNGIIFGGGSQINVHTLVASSLPINDNLVSRGLLNNPDVQFLFTALPEPAGTNGTPAFTPPAALTANGADGDVVVEPGAELSAPTTAAHVGGRIALIGPNVRNEGTISTPDGQTILAAGLQVGVAAHPSSDASLRGLDVFVGEVSDPSLPNQGPAGTAVNSGLIEAPRADVTIAGMTVNNLGVIDSTTSVALNGRVDLDADYNAIGNPAYNSISNSDVPLFIFESDGTVTFGPGSTIRILPELSSADRVVGATLSLPSQVNVQALAIHMASDASILAPDASVAFNAGVWAPDIAGPQTQDPFDFSAGQIYLDGGALINVAGSSDVAAPVSENIISVQLRGTELADSPLQRNGALRGQTIEVDIRDTGVYDGQTWQGTPLADTSGYVGDIERSVGELTTNGGSVTFTSGNSVVMQRGSSVNVSGGWIDYQGGMVQTTRVISGGELFDISKATPDMAYQGIFTGQFTAAHPKWGISYTYTDALAPNGAHYEAGFTEGGNGGSVAITAPAVALDGNLLGITVAGPRQRTVAPAASSLALNFQGGSGGSLIQPSVVIEPGASLPSPEAFTEDASGDPLSLSADRVDRVILSPDLVGADGFGALTINNSDGGITLAANASMNAQVGGAITLLAANLDIEGKITAPGGSLNFTVFDFSPSALAGLNASGLPTPPANPGRGHFTLGSLASLNTAGLVVDDRPDSAAPNTLALETNGGSITINTYSADIAPGSVINASGGVAISPAGKPAYGNGGSITIAGGQDPNVASDIGGKLTLGATLEAYSGATAGSLNITAPMIQIGGATVNADTLLLSPDFFSKGGFGSFTLKGIGVPAASDGEPAPAFLITPDTVIAPQASSLVALKEPDGGLALTPMLLPQAYRTPVSLAFSALGVKDTFIGSLLVVRGDLVMGDGAVIRTDPEAKVSLSGNTAAVLGSIIDPGGSIQITGGKSYIDFNTPSEALPTLDLGPNSFLSAAGATVLTQDPRGRHTGSVLPGGSITLNGNIVAEAGATLDVSGASDTLDVPAVDSSVTNPLRGSFAGAPLLPLKIDTNAGSITLQGQQELFSDATLLARAGGPTAVGGSLFVSANAAPTTFVGPLNVDLVVTQSGPLIPAPFYAAGQTAIGHPVVDTRGDVIPGMGYFAADSFADGGFASLALGGGVQFKGPVQIDAAGSLTVGNSGAIFADSSVRLSADYVSAGASFVGPQSLLEQQAFLLSQQTNGQFFAPTNGPGSLSISGNFIDIGNLSLQNIGNAAFIAENGDIRGDGTLDVAGNIYLRAGQIYPPTAVSFTISASDFQRGGVTAPGSVTIAASGNRQLPLSAGGQINVYASIINQGGVLRAPLGGINIGWDGVGTAPEDIVTGAGVATTKVLTLFAGSVTSVSAVDPSTGQALIVPYGINANGNTWIDPTGTDITAGGVPGKAVNLSAANVIDQAGSSIDISGGGDLYAYRFVSGLSGNQDILASNASFAVIPGYGSAFAPFAPYDPNATNLGGDAGYTNSALSAGSQVYLGASNGLSAGMYTLLPARYALLPGAFLVTPRTGAPTGTVSLPDGSSLVSGYRVGLAQSGQPLLTSFEVDPQSVVRSRAEYDDSFANTFLGGSAVENGAAAPRLPIDAGHLVFEATQGMTLQGAVAAAAPAGGLGGLVDISSPLNILIAGPSATAPSGVLVLNSSELSSFGAESLLIGGLRTIGAGSTAVTVQTGNLTVNNPGAPLSVQDLILVANDTLTLGSGAEIQQSDAASSPAEALVLGDAATPGSGDGVLLRVSNDPSAAISRQGVDASPVPSMVVDAGARLSAASLILDSTHATSLSPDAILKGQSVSLDSGQISIRLDDSVSLQPTSGLVLSGVALQTLQDSVEALSLLSYSSLDIYGTGEIGSPTIASLALHAAEFRGFNDGGTVRFAAENILLDNAAGGASPGPVLAMPEGTLEFDAKMIRLGANQLNVDQYANLAFIASGGIIAASSGDLVMQGGVSITTPIVTGAGGVTYGITASGALTMPKSPSDEAEIAGGLGANLTFEGASVTANTDILLPSGQLTLHATTGDVTIGGGLDAAGTARNFFDLVKYTDGGQITLTSDAGDVIMAAGSTVSVAAQAGGGNAGTLSVSAPQGDFTTSGVLQAQGGAGGQAGSFSLDVGSLPSAATLDASLNAASFAQSRSIRVRTGDILIDGLATTRNFNLSADAGSITVSGEINASGAQGGAIGLEAYGSVTLLNGSLLTVAGANFNDAGQGGAVSLEAGSETNGSYSSTALVDIQAGSTINLSVAANTATSATAGDFTGTLHIRAPQTTVGAITDLQVNPINGSILNASSIMVEGYKLYTPANGSIDSVEGSAATSSANDGTVYGDSEGFAANTAAILSALLVGTPNAGQASLFQINPGAEIINPNLDTAALPTAGDLTLAGNWDLSTFRFGPNAVPGFLTLRAGGDITFNGALSDGFTSALNTASLTAQNTALPANSQAWSYQIAAGADFTAADANRVQPLASLPAGGGSLNLGQLFAQNHGIAAVVPGGNNATSTALLAKYYQVIRTGAGSIDIAAAGNVELLNQFATIYTAGAQVTDPTLGGSFDVPVLNGQGGTIALGALQGQPLVQYSLGGGNVTVAVQGNIEHQTGTSLAALVPDSERELPMNWLYRRGYVDPVTGEFGVAKFGGVASTSWWVDFSNFFEGVGALGGGNVALTAGGSINNVDAVAPTNARMPGVTPNAAGLVELGGGDVTVRAGNDINGGVYYVERGQGTLSAGNQILTNSTRSPSLGNLSVPATTDAPETWLPTTLFLGDGSFNVTAGGDLLLGPVANPFLLPEGISNTFWYKTYFSTYASSDSVNVSSLTGDVTLREEAALPDTTGATPLLQAWLQNVLLLTPGQPDAAYYQPWLRLDETSVASFSTVTTLMPSTLRATAFSGNIDLDGNIILTPSPTGTLDLAAAGSINGLQINGVLTSGGISDNIWDSSEIDLSDANPAALPGITSPYAYQILAGLSLGAAPKSTANFLSFISAFFNESGSTEGAFGVLQTKEALHAPGPLHAGDPQPVHLYALDGDISGVTLFSGKSARVIAGSDITDIALYPQNDNSGDVSVVAAGLDIMAYDPNSPLRTAAQEPGNELDNGLVPLAGDIQISGPGTLEVLAGRDLNLGIGPNNSDGTGVGITSIGNARNPSLPFTGANVIVGAGIGSSSGLDASTLDFTKFIASFLDPKTAGDEAARYLPDLGQLMGSTDTADDAVWNAFGNLPAEQQDTLALDIFYLVLRDAGRDHDVATSSGFNNYNAGYAAVRDLFPTTGQAGDISLTSREIKTDNGGDISLFAPNGQLTVGLPGNGNPPIEQGILTEDGGNISIFTNGNVNVGVSRIFTLRGGNEIIWSTVGDIAAGASSKTVQSAPPTQVLIDPQSADVQTDLAGLATGGGIGVLESVVGVPPGDVDLIAPLGTVDAGDAGIRVSGNLNISAAHVLNTSNIQVGGASAGVPVTVVAAPNLAGLTSASNTAGAATSAGDAAAKQAESQQTGQQDIPSLITVEVLGYGGGDDTATP